MAAPQQEFVIARVFAAPRELVWQALTECEHLRQWWGPVGFTMHTCTIDLRPGGRFLYGMRSPDGQDLWGKFVYREIVPPERLDFLSAFADAAGNTVRAPFGSAWPLEVLSTWTLSEEGGRTTLTIRSTPFDATEPERQAFAAGFDSMRQGFAGTFDQLAAYLAKQRED
jgi:uncharacterized protein YndB with AHSA1/START domain